jgi:hypothetical protein
MAEIPYADQLACAERELKLRHRVYPRWVEQGRMSRQLADRELLAMQAIVATLKELAEKERLL